MDICVGKMESVVMDWIRKSAIAGAYLFGCSD